MRALAVAVLDLLLAAALILRALGHKIVQSLVVLGQVRRRTAGIDDAALRHLTRLVRLVVLLRLGLLLRLRGLLRLGGLLLRGAALRRLGGRCLRLGLGLVGHFVELLQAGRLMVLREILKNVVELCVLEHLHMIFRSGGVIRQDLRDLLRGHVEILRHLMHSVFNHHIRISSLSPSAMSCFSFSANPRSHTASTPAFLPMAAEISSMVNAGSKTDT